MGIITNTTKERLEELKQQQETISEKILIEKSKQKMTLTKNFLSLEKLTKVCLQELLLFVGMDKNLFMSGKKERKLGRSPAGK